MFIRKGLRRASEASEQSFRGASEASYLGGGGAGFGLGGFVVGGFHSNECIMDVVLVCYQTIRTDGWEVNIIICLREGE